HRRNHEMDVMGELRELLAMPNIASNVEDIRRNAEHLVRMMDRRGIRARVLELDGAPPAVYGELTTPGATRTVVLYAHFDGQPVDGPGWLTDPWQPTLVAGRLEDGAPPPPAPAPARRAPPAPAAAGARGRAGPRPGRRPRPGPTGRGTGRRAKPPPARPPARAPPEWAPRPLGRPRWGAAGLEANPR